MLRSTAASKVTWLAKGRWVVLVGALMVAGVLLYASGASSHTTSGSYTFVTMWGSFGTGDGQFDWPVSVATDSSGNVYVADYHNSRIQKFSSDGTFITKWGGSDPWDWQFDGPTGVATDSSGNVYVAEYLSDRIQKFAPPDTRAPKVERVLPAQNATGIGPRANVSAFFSEAMRKGSINTNTFKLYKAGTTTAIGAQVSYDAQKKKAILNPEANLKLGAKYKAVVTPGATDKAGNPLDQNPTLSGNQPKKWFFTVKN